MTTTRKRYKTKWPFRDMEIGDSHFIAFPAEYGDFIPPMIASAWQSRMAALAGNYRPKKFKTEIDHYNGGVRVRRVA